MPRRSRRGDGGEKTAGQHTGFGRKLATRPRPIRPDKRGGVASSEDQGRRARSGKKQAEQAAGTAGAVTTRTHLPITPTNTRGPSTPHRETGRRSKGVRPLRQPGEKPGQRGRIESLQNKNGIAGGRGTTSPLFPITEGQQKPSRWDNKLSPPLQTTNTEEGRGVRREARGGEETRGVSNWRGIGDEESQREPREQRYRRRERTGTSVSHRTSISLSESTEGISGPTWPTLQTIEAMPGKKPNHKPVSKPARQLLFSEALQHKRLTPTKINPQISPPLNESTTMSDKDQSTTMDRILQEITTVSRRIEGMDASITSLTLETKSMRSDIAGFQSRVTGLEQRMGSLETQINTSQEREQDFIYLRSKLTGMEDRSRRDNIRVLGIPENEEGSDMQAFLTSTLPKMISLDFDPPLEFQLAHRIGPKRSDNSSRPAKSSHGCCGIIKPDKYSK
ncbi:hypothetical protein NDU88_001727 [Pleurodeles waltl]|uniref:Uncharacterized protein n=1 Tax=Pleurodeles waltl TaxID=8319 RepID=A0AAV7MVF8_PLEWA|nr:hypothetical protein NDU88_001727 [Pleurodeles waltl]